MELSIIFLPLIASIVSGFFGRYIGDRNSEIITSALVSISALLSIHILYQVIVNQYEENIIIATWITSGSLDVNWSMLIDPLSAVMLVVVTSVSALVHIYSIISGFFGRYIGDRNSEIVTSALVSISALLSIHVLYQVIVNQYEENIVIATWISSGSLDVNWSMLDRKSVV